MYDVYVLVFVSVFVVFLDAAPATRDGIIVHTHTSGMCWVCEREAMLMNMKRTEPEKKKEEEELAYLRSDYSDNNYSSSLTD